MTRRVNKYLLTVPVSDWQTAKDLGSETSWRILEELRNVGIEGLSADAISEKIGVPVSTVYSNLSKLASAQWVESTTRRLPWGRPSRNTKKRSRGKPTRVFIQKLPWGNSEFDCEFMNTLETVIENMKNEVDELREKWLSILEKIIARYKTNELDKFYPQEPVHETCGHSHEGMEFIDAVSLSILWEILSGKDFDAFARKYKFMK